MALPQTGTWHRAYQDPYGTTVYLENDDGSIGLYGIHFADGTFQTTAATAGGGGLDGIQSVSTTSAITFGGSTNSLVKATAGAGGITLTLPTAVGIAGQTLRIKKVDSAVGVVTISTVSSQTIDGTLFGTSCTLTNFMQYISLESDGANWLTVGGN